MAGGSGLLVRLGGRAADLVFDRSRPIVIGRDELADVVVTDLRASRKHVVLTPRPPDYWVLEDTSANGTFCNGERIGRVALTDPIRIQLGHPLEGITVDLALIPGPTPTSVSQIPVGRPAEPAHPPVGHGPDDRQQSQIGVFSSVYQPNLRVTIGRDPSNDIVINDLLVSRHHAELISDGRGGFQVVDRGSHNGTYVDGQSVSRATVHDGAIIAIGHHLYRLSAGRLEEYIDSGMVSLAAIGVTVLAGAKVLLDECSFALEAGAFLAVLGPTGAGKSTLVKALTGTRPADRGQVLYNGRNLYTTYAELRHRIGYVPQDDILHPQLTVRKALSCSARLRFPADVAEADRETRVEEVMAELGLSDRADLPVASLSGGQRKRTSVAIELLTKPSLLLLDEPTSGLDPGYEKSVMDLLRRLADGGRTIIAVTHSVQSLDHCDRILFLAPGGQTAYFGPPAEALPYFRVNQYADVFQALERSHPGAAQAAFRQSGTHHRYIDLLVDGRASGSSTPPPAQMPPPSASWGHQLRTLLTRYLSVIVADRRNTALLLLQAPVLGLLMLFVLGHDHLGLRTTPNSDAGTVLLALVLGAVYLGTGNSVREIVKERAILTRERSVGLSPSAYVLSKATLLGALTMIQALVLMALGVARQNGPGHGAILASGRLELFLTLSLTGLSAMALGLLISAFANNPDKALTLLPVVLLAQFMLSGAVFNVQSTPVLNQLSYLTSARWGYVAAASSANLDGLAGRGCGGAAAHPTGSKPGARGRCDARQRHSISTWAIDMAALTILTILPLAGATLAVRPLGQPRRR